MSLSRDPRQRLGRAGERAAEAYLERAGLRVVARRFRSRAGEIDLVAVDGEVVVFVEVKARRDGRFGTPAEAVTARKRQRMARAGLAWLVRSGGADRPARFDVVEVVGEETRGFRVRHIPDAFRLWPGGRPGSGSSRRI